MSLFFYPHLNEPTFTFSEEESNHCIKVLRHKTGDILKLIDGKGGFAEAIIENAHPKKCFGKLLSVQHFKPNRQYRVSLGIAPTKQHERMDWLIEKSVEIGIDEIQFMQCANSERPRINLDRLQKIAISAMKQSKQYYLPQFKEMLPFKDCLEQDATATKLIAYCETGYVHPIKQYLLPQASFYQILIGPEGDFTPAEVHLAKQYGYQEISLGSNILRTETAALTVLASLAQWHEWH